LADKIAAARETLHDSALLSQVERRELAANE
jgi:hypothetical protein